MPVFLIILLIINALWIFIGGILHITLLRDMGWNDTRNRFVSIYGIIYANDELVLGARMTFIALCVPFTFVLECMYIFVSMIAVLISYYSHADKEELLERWFTIPPRYDDHDYIISRSMISHLIRSDPRVRKLFESCELRPGTRNIMTKIYKLEVDKS